MRYLIYSLVILLFFLPNLSYGQNGHYMPGGIDLHDPGLNPWSDRSLWTCVFQDEFNYSGIPDPDKWEVRTDGKDIAGAGAASVYRANNVTVGNGVCKILMKEESATENGEHFDFTSGEIRTLFSDNDFNNGSFSFTEGMFEARIKMSSAFWAHHNFWLLGGNTKTDGEYEIDIAECRGSVHSDFVNARKQVPHRIHRYINKCIPDLDPRSIEKGKDVSVNFRVDKDFHTYTCIWDMHYIHFYVDHKLTLRYERFQYAGSNDDNLASHFDLGANNYMTLPGYYWKHDHFPYLNSRLNLILHIFMDKRDADNVKRKIHKHNSGLPASMEIDWVRVYMRTDCKQNEEITNSVLLPYEGTDRYIYRDANTLQNRRNAHNHRPRHLTLGTQNGFTSWQNIAAPWETGRYQAETITLLPNYISYPEWVDATPCNSNDNSNTKLSSTLFIATSCPEVNNAEPGSENEYIEVVIPEYDTTEVDTFDCSDIDTAWVDSTINASLLAGDTLFADSIISYIVDTLGCTYWGDTTGGGQSRPGRGVNNRIYRTVGDPVSEIAGAIKVYPNPNNGTFTIELPKKGNYDIRVTNIVGATVYSSGMDGERRKEIVFDKNISPGNYTIYIQGEGLRHIEKITLMR